MSKDEYEFQLKKHKFLKRAQQNGGRFCHNFDLGEFQLVEDRGAEAVFEEIGNRFDLKIFTKPIRHIYRWEEMRLAQ